jgi:hypothetical protein
MSAATLGLTPGGVGRGTSTARAGGVGGGGALGSPAPPGGDATPVSESFFDSFNKRAQSRFEDAPDRLSLHGGGGANSAPGGRLATDVSTPPDDITRHGRVRHKYSATDLLARLRQMLGMKKGVLPLPRNVDADSVPLRTVQPGDAMFEFTVEGSRANGGGTGARGDTWSGGGTGAGGRHDDNVPEWAREETDAVDPGGASFLGGTVPKLTAAEAASNSWLDHRSSASLHMPRYVEGGLVGGGSVGIGDHSQSALMGALEDDGDSTNAGGGAGAGGGAVPGARTAAGVGGLESGGLSGRSVAPLHARDSVPLQSPPLQVSSLTRAPELRALIRELCTVNSAP